MKSIRRAVVFATFAAFAFSCDGLGNPPLRSTTPTARFANSVGEAITTSETVASSHRDDLRAILSSRPDVVDAHLDASPFMTLVHVRTTSPGRIFLTRLTLIGGTLIEREWRAPRARESATAVFAVPEPPASVLTELR